MKKFTAKLCMAFSVCVLISVNSLHAQSNQYLDFDGVDDFVTVPNASQLIAGSTAFSMTGWFYDAQLSYGKGLMGFRATNAGFYLIELNNGAVECRFQNSGGTLFSYQTPDYTIVPQVWQHFAWVYGGGSLKLYVNGNLITTLAASGTITSTTTAFAIGKSILAGFNFVYKGGIDEVSVWNKALSQTEIQDMMANELTGSEPNLQMYFKFNQGVPGGNNTGISALHDELQSPLYDGVFNLFALNGTTSNFLGTLNSSFQVITFPQILPQLTTWPCIILNATATSTLPVIYTLLSGPATLNGDTLCFTGPGTVSIQADQPGNMSWDTAATVINTFDVVDPYANGAVIEPRNPVDGANVYMPALGKLELAAIASIPYPTLFSISNLEFVINSVHYPATNYYNGHYTSWWTPAAYGAYTIQINATSNYGVVSTANVNVNVTSTVTNIDTIPAFSGIWLDSSTPSAIADGVMPSFVGAFDTITAILTVTCPIGGCGDYDRIASVDAKGMDGQWFEVIRYITPYSVPCSHRINLADYMSLLQGKVTFRVNCATLDNGYVYKLQFDYRQGPPPHIYSDVTKIWKNVYPFGDYANLQPVPVVNYSYQSLAVASKLKLVSAGHGWGALNTGNAAEFYDATHHVYVNGVSTFTQHNWQNCNPNPDACSPQNGTWTYARAGWCPGSIAHPFDFDLTPFVSAPIDLMYEFQTSYLDQCHPNNPSCVSGVTCTDCLDGFNPVLDVNCNLITWYDNPITLGVSDIEKPEVFIYPNPSQGMFNLRALSSGQKNYSVIVFDMLGNAVKKFNWNGERTTIDLSSFSKGVYVLKVNGVKETEIKKLIVQ